MASVRQLHCMCKGKGGSRWRVSSGPCTASNHWLVLIIRIFNEDPDGAA